MTPRNDERLYITLAAFAFSLASLPATAADNIAREIYPPSMKFADVFGRAVEVRRPGANAAITDPTIADAESAAPDTRSNVTARDAVRAVLSSVGAERLRCADLKSLKLPWVRINSAEDVAAQKNAMAHCRVLATIDKEITIEVDLPSASDWNGKFLMGGSGGFLGDLNNGMKPVSLLRGYATAVTDTGHLIPKDIPGASWAYQNPERLVNFGHRATHVAQATAKLIIRAYYKHPIRLSYFYGTSGSGRQSMMEAQRYPDDFDGIVAACPGYNWTRGIALATAWTQQSMFPTLEDEVNYRPVMPASKVKLMDDAVHKKCDGADGLVDGVITNPLACKFNPHEDLPRCSKGADGPSCFTPREIDVIDRIHKGPSNADGQIWAGWPYGGESIDGQWTARAGGYVIGSAEGPKENPTLGPYFTRHYFLSNENFKYLIFGDPNYDLHSFNFETDMPAIIPAAAQIDANDPDLSSFQRRKGKLLIYAGWSDWSVNPLSQVDYYERVLAKMGGRDKVAEFARLFLIPGNGHCNVADATKKVPNVVDFVTALEGWVEHDKAPDSIIASHYAVEPGGKPIQAPVGMPIEARVDRTRPICAYPTVATYKGSGSIDEASNFVCKGP